jgi:iron complex outermembrane recepter protein
VPLVPGHKLNLGLSWDVTPKTRFTAALAALTSQYMDNDEPNTLGVKIPRRAIADLKLAHDFGWGRAAVAVNNLFDHGYYDYAVRSAFIADRYAVYPLAGRTFGASIEARLD